VVLNSTEMVMEGMEGLVSSLVRVVIMAVPS
jgi:hypothetical protein